MDFHERTLSVALPPDRVREILIGEEHITRIEGYEDFFKPHAVYLTWSEAEGGRLESSLSYFRSKNLCVFRVFADIEAEGQGAKVTLSSGHGPWSKLAMGAAWVDRVLHVHRGCHHPVAAVQGLQPPAQAHGRAHR
jgi:hypothetical protein